MMQKANPEIQKVLAQCLQENIDYLRSAGFSEREISKAMKTATRKVLIDISKEHQKEKFAKTKSEDKK